MSSETDSWNGESLWKDGVKSLDKRDIVLFTPEETFFSLLKNEDTFVVRIKINWKIPTTFLLHCLAHENVELQWNIALLCGEMGFNLSNSQVVILLND